jgi:hypothetical protein
MVGRSKRLNDTDKGVVALVLIGSALVMWLLTLAL